MVEKNQQTDRFVRFSIATDTVLKNIQKYKNDRLEEFGLRSMHLMFMVCLDRSAEGMTPTELARSCRVDKAFISRVTHELCERGFVAYDDSEQRRKRICMTESGRHVMDAINEIIHEVIEKVTSGISREQMETFYDVISRLDVNLLGLAEDAT